jgi:hypothetical protein
VDHSRLAELIASLEPLRSEESDDAVRVSHAVRLIEDIRIAHTDVQLADNCFCLGDGMHPIRDTALAVVGRADRLPLCNADVASRLRSAGRQLIRAQAQADI